MYLIIQITLISIPQVLTGSKGEDWIKSHMCRVTRILLLIGYTMEKIYLLYDY